MAREYLALRCKKCGETFPLKLVGLVGQIELQKLSDPFQATCTACRQPDSYPLSAILTLREE